ncbi:hypothetical protein BB561_001556 [Smittium simulii]|uniref:Sulfurtransferase n=1 Tax=Smittium simulii TaxID=133385 RepID=A0A2T9YU26_9FUNG|nr:hypothetical protein BB561_001556 [Smittium simulii]
MNRNTHAEYLHNRIKESIFFDIDKVKDQSTDLPHMLPSEQEFNSFMDAHGVSNTDQIIVYDSHGFMGACRLLWTLDASGLKDWEKITNLVESGNPAKPIPTTGYQSRINSNLITTKPQILEAIKTLQHSTGLKGPQIIDARPAPRFDGKEQEPRPGLTCGHMPFSINVPFTELFTISEFGGAKCKSKTELDAVFNTPERMIDLHTRPIITTCGSGITAACLYAALSRAGAEHVSVYDGSWSEYGLDKSNPLATTTQA